MIRSCLTALALLVGASAAAQQGGDPAVGERLFSNCTTCHAVIAPGGRVLVGGPRVGPNLYGVAGSRAASDRGFDYSPWLGAAGQQGLTWTAANFAAYLRNPTDFMKAYLNDDSARARMAYRQTSNAADIFAYLQSLTR